MVYTLQEILSRAAEHPIYSPLLVREATATKPEDLTLQAFKLLDKDYLVKSIETLIKSDITFLHGVYLSPTGGTRRGPMLFFVTDIKENKIQRQVAAQVLKEAGMLEPTDIVLNLHNGTGPMYQAQNLTGELIENVGSTQLSVGSHIPDDTVLEFAKRFKANAIFAPSSRAVQFARYLSGLPEEERITIPKVFYTSEPFPPSQEVYVGEILKAEKLSGMFGSAEAGPWACVLPRPIRKAVDADITQNNYSELLFSRKQMIVEIISETGEVLDNSIAEGQQKSTVGEMVLTSLVRRRNPLLRYRTGDMGSLHSYESGRGEYVILRFYGRNPIISFCIDSDYINISSIDERVFSKPEHDVLEWQVIISPFSDEELKREAEGTFHEWLEFRIVTRGNRKLHDRKEREDHEEQVRQDLLNNAIGSGLKTVVKVVDHDGFIKGRVARKFIKIVDQRPT